MDWPDFIMNASAASVISWIDSEAKCPDNIRLGNIMVGWLRIEEDCDCWIQEDSMDSLDKN